MEGEQSNMNDGTGVKQTTPGARRWEGDVLNKCSRSSDRDAAFKT